MSTAIRKRKRHEKKRVRFDTKDTIIDTYSPLDYDRGSIFSFPIQYKLNPNIPHLQITPPSSPSDDHKESPSFLIEKKRPKLSIDTSNCAGPLFLTKLSTNHIRHKLDDDDSMNDYLIPVTPTSAFPPSSLY